ncbi:hypothetical protein PPUTLS46_011475 [Pseudomonas putida LS46]|nr:hypothetical protein PPUTLS46_011475 [Pseudomonas putida LS46]
MSLCYHYESLPGLLRVQLMDSKPTNGQVAVKVGIDESQVERYRTESLQLGDGSWLVHFSYEMPKELRHSFTGSFTAIIASETVGADDRSD